MSGADDQRLAPTETQRLRNQIDDLTRERDLYKRMLERYEPDPTYSTPTELDRLRAELAETRAAGDALAVKAAQVSEDINDQFEFLSEILDDGVHEWRQATDPEYANARLGRPVRGDAPTQPPAAMPYAWGGGDGGRYFPTVEAPAVARTDGQPPTVEEPVPSRLVCGACGAVDEMDDEVDGLTAEQYRHVYDDLIHGLATDLGLDPDKAGGGSITAAVRRLVAGVSVPQKPAESTGGARCEHGVPVTRWCSGCTLAEHPPDGDR